MRTALALLRRDLGLAFGGRGGPWLPVLFFVAVAVLFPFAVGPDAPLLARTGGGVLWIAALLAAILPIDRLVAPDIDNGVFDQLTLRGVSEELVLVVRLLAHWLSFGPLLLIAALPAAALFDLPAETLRTLLLGLALGTPGLAAIGLVIAALTATVRGGAALGGLLLIPLAVPVLIFGAGALARPDSAGLALCGAISLALCAVAPFAGAGAVRAARES
ncbi:heme exporter protein CcmB [Tsuneonella rigui]|uniref:heme exporter protein CcmB n=1 Tax=Tsuneonella rigui TaxID=1708790 RepID=UPI000F7DB5E4|nr:heme exporter protein CcmB [Tsuneonella rigui]